MIKGKLFRVFILLSALALAGIAAYFSVFGMTKIFGNGIQILLMASSFEFGKIMLASFMYREWKRVHGIKIYMTFALIILMAITSVGIYGFLSYSYKTISVDFKAMTREVSLNTEKQSVSNNKIERLKEQKKEKQNRIDYLNNAIKTLDSRIDDSNRKFSATSLSKRIAEYNEEIKVLMKEINEIEQNILNEIENGSKLKINTSDLETKSEKKFEIVFLTFLSKIFHTDVDNVAHWFMIIIILVFDPMALTLIVAYNFLLQKETTFENIFFKEKK